MQISNKEYRTPNTEVKCRAGGLVCRPRTFFGYRVIAMGTPGVAAGYALHAQPDALNNAPFLNGLYRVVRAGGGVATVRSQQGRKCCLVDLDGQYEEFTEHYWALRD
jgi:hypothetical protein